MSAVGSPTPAPRMPDGVRIALVLLWGSWTISTVFLIVQLAKAGGVAAVSDAIFGSLALSLNAFLIYLMCRGNDLGRNFYLGFMLLGVLAMLATTPFAAALSMLSSPRFDLRVGTQAIAMALLFTPTARHWFKQMLASKVASNHRLERP